MKVLIIGAGMYALNPAGEASEYRAERMELMHTL